MCSCSRVLWKVEFVSNEIQYLVEVISKQSVEGTAWLLLNVYGKMKEERSDLMMELSINRETELKKLSTYLYCKKWESIFWREY